MATRFPAAAGTFYPSSPARLREAVSSLSNSNVPEDHALALIVPHAGLAYSGRVAGETYARTIVPSLVCLLATNHTGSGPPFSVWPDGSWETPAGAIPVDAGLTRALLSGCPGAQADTSAAMDEHSGEVQIPFILHRNPSARLAAVTVGAHLLPARERLSRLKAFGSALGRVLREAGEPVLCVASTDMSHVGASFSVDPPPGLTADAFARDQDQAALAPLLALDPDGLERIVRERGVTMCGWGPVVAVIAAALAQGAARAELVRYATSADATGDTGHVVGYAGVRIA